MKKSFALIIILLAALFGVASFGGCSASDNGGSSSYDDPVDYYGCPNSKRIQKLNLKKRTK